MSCISSEAYQGQKPVVVIGVEVVLAGKVKKRKKQIARRYVRTATIVTKLIRVVTVIIVGLHLPPKYLMVILCLL